MLAVGVDTHKESLAVCAVDEVGRLVAEGTFRNDPAGHACCVAWLKELPAPRRVGVEGSAHLGAAFSAFLVQHGEQVFEVPAIRTNRERRRTGRLWEIRSGRRSGHRAGRGPRGGAPHGPSRLLGPGSSPPPHRLPR